MQRRPFRVSRPASKGHVANGRAELTQAQYVGRFLTVPVRHLTTDVTVFARANVSEIGSSDIGTPEMLTIGQ